MSRSKRRRLSLLDGPYSEPYDRAAIKAAHGQVCYLCGQPGKLTLDHVIPVGRGGPDAPWNLRLACAGCNRRKADRLLSELSWEPALPPSDPGLWVVLGPGEMWAPSTSSGRTVVEQGRRS